MAVLEMSRSAPACNLFSLPGDSTMNAQYALTQFVNDDTAISAGSLRTQTASSSTQTESR